MTTLKEKLQQLCRDDFQGLVQIRFCNPKAGIFKSQWFYLYAVPLICFSDYLDCDVVGEEISSQPEDSDGEMQITVAV